MKYLRTLTIVGLMQLGLMGCAATSQDKQALEEELANANSMTEQELLDTLPGATVSSVSETDGTTPWTQTYSELKEGQTKGTLTGVYGGDEYDAKWYIKDGKWCENWGSGRACWNMELVEDGKAIQRYGKKGKLKQLMYIE